MAKKPQSRAGTSRAAARAESRAAAREQNPNAARRTAAAQNAARERMSAEPDLPRWLAPVLFAVATVALFPEVFFHHNTLFGSDTFGLSYFAREFYTGFVRTHHAFPLWDPMVLGGLPFLEGMHGDIFYPLSLAFFFMSAKDMWAWKMVLHIFLAGVFSYIWLRRGMKLRRGPAMFGAIVYMMGADLVSLVSPGGDGKLFVSALAPLVFWLAERAAVGRRLSDFAAFALGITLIILTSHMQLVYFCIWGVTAYFFFRVWEIWRDEGDNRAPARLIGLFALAGILGTGAAAIQVLPPLGYVRETSLRVGQRSDPTQTYLEATSFSLHPEEVMSLAVPEFVGQTRPGIKDGQPLPPTYWGRNPFKLNHEYAGVIALLLLPIMFLRRRRRVVWFFLGLAVFSLLFAVGATTPLFHLFILIPGVKLFRAPSLIIFLYAMSISTLGAMAVQRVAEWRAGDENDAKAVSRYLWIALGFTAFLALMASSGMLIDFWRNAIYDPGAFDDYKNAALTANLGHIHSGFWILFLFAALITAWWIGLRRGMIGARTAVIAILVLAVADLYRVDRPFISQTAAVNDAVKDSPYFGTDSVLSYLQHQAADSTHVFRVANFVDPAPPNDYAYEYSRNTLAIHGIEQVAGLHGNEIGRYVNLVGQDGMEAFSSIKFLSFVNAEYVLVFRPLNPTPGFEQVATAPGAALYRNTAVWPRAFLVGHAQFMSDSLAVAGIHAGALDLRRSATVAEGTPELAQLQADPQGSVQWLQHSPNHLRMRVTTDRPSMIVITDNYYPAWRATVGGKPAHVYRADYTFRGIVVPAGTNDVEMYYSTDHLRAAGMTSIVLMLLLLGVFVGGFVRPGIAATDDNDRVPDPDGIDRHDVDIAADGR